MITQKRLKKLFYYEDGVLKRRVRTTNSVNVGDVAGALNGEGYNMIKIDGKTYKRSRLIWLYHNGYIPEGMIDHINKIRDDDRIENLREIGPRCNCRNNTLRKDNRTGVKGVIFHKATNMWMANVRVNNKSIYLGVFNCFDEAVLHRLAAEQCLDWDGCESNSSAFQYALNNDLISKKYKNLITNETHLYETKRRYNCFLRKDNNGGVTGVTENKKYKTWKAYIRYDGKLKHLGSFKYFGAAVLARLSEERRLKIYYDENKSSAYKFALKNGLIEK